MAASVAEAFVTVRPDTDRFGGELKGKLGGLAKVAGAAAIGIGAAITGAAVAGVKAFAGFERQMNEVFTLLPGISEDAMGEMQDDVRTFAKEMGTATTEVVPALYQAISAGVPRENVFDFLEVANKAAIGGVTDLETAVDGISSVVNAYGEDVIDAGKASDLMFTAVRLGKTNFEELSASLFNVIPTASSLGVQFEDITGALAAMTAQGTPTSVATTQLRQLLVELSKEGSKTAETFTDIADQSFPEFIAGGGDVQTALWMMSESAKESGGRIADMFGSVEAGAAAATLTSESGADAFDGAMQQMAASAGATDAAFETMNQGLSRSWDRIKVVFSDLLLELGERIAPALQRFADWFETNLPGIMAWFERTGEKAGEMGQALSDWWTDVAKPAVDEFVAAIQTNWPKVESIFESLGEVAASVGGIFSDEFGAMADNAEEGSTGITESVSSVLSMLQALATTVATVSNVARGAWGLFRASQTADNQRMVESLDLLSGGAFSRLVDAAKEKTREVLAWFRRLPGAIREAFGNVGNLLRGAGREIIDGLIGGITSKFAAVRSKLSDLTSMLPSWKGPESVDKKLLRGPAFTIMEGFASDLMRAAHAEVMPTLNALTGDMVGNVTPGPVGAAASGGSQYHLHMTTGRSDADIMEQFRRMELVHG